MNDIDVSNLGPAILNIEIQIISFSVPLCQIVKQSGQCHHNCYTFLFANNRENESLQTLFSPCFSQLSFSFSGIRKTCKPINNLFLRKFALWILVFSFHSKQAL